MRRADKNANGEVIERLEGSCPTCGPVSLTAGEWRIFDNRSG
jgi:Fe-S cluster biogenesis protein NfuA